MAAIRLHERDNVVVARLDLAPGAAVEGVAARAAIPRGHKLASEAIAKGAAIRKYGQIIGFATADIAPGEHVHTHNCAMGDFARETRPCADARPTPFVPEAERAHFQGFRRASGRVGTRNYLGVLTSVNCSATVARHIAEAAERAGLFDDHPTIDGVVPVVHGTGCGMAASGEGWGNFRRLVQGYAAHPNFAGVLLVGLGCEAAQIPSLIAQSGLEEGESFRAMTIQEAGGARATVEWGLGVLREMIPAAAAQTRTREPASELTLALQCGGSDGYSGVTANPALGAAADRLVAHGGTAILAETPEIYGAEHLLTARAETPKVAEKLMARIRWWEEHTARMGAEMNNNPSPGNKAGGLTTILEKSLGAAAKGGSTNLVDVYRYAERATRRGFVFMDSPGYDPASVTGQVATGANLICFTTGRGSVFGYKPAPSIKLATNTPMYDKMREDMDVNCGPIADGEASVEDKGREIFDLILRVASGEQTKSEAFGFGGAEFVPWQIGAVM